MQLVAAGIPNLEAIGGGGGGGGAVAAGGDAGAAAGGEAEAKKDEVEKIIMPNFKNIGLA